MAESPGKLGVLFVHAEGEPPLWGETISHLSEVIPDQVFEVRSLTQADAAIQGDWAGVVYLVMSTKDDLVHIINFLLRHQAKIKMAKTVRVGVFSSVDHTQIVTFLQKSGVTEVLDFNTNQKAIAHKISTHLKVIEKILSGGERKGIEFDKSFKGKSGDLSGGNQQVGTAQVTPLRTRSVSLPEVEESRWETGANAFAPKGATSKWQGNPVEIVNQVERLLTLDVPKKDWKIGEKFTLDFETVNLDLAPLLKMNGTVESTEASELEGRSLVSVQLDPASAKLYEDLQNKLDELQTDIQDFMKEAKG
jgi:hypothetical protein